MCGIVGFVGYGGLPSGTVANIAQRMGEAIRHRGPDDSGIWQDNAAQVALAHRRLSILDLSPAGHQPMMSASGRYVIAFNGEIYNHLELRADLEKVGAGGTAGLGWRGHSDTETLLAGVDAWGLEETLKRCVGMFALALWDRQDRVLSLARDRIGEKPLYYGWQNGVFLFGSELKALKAHPAFVGEINRDAITLQLRHNYIPAPYSIYQGIFKLLPGSVLQIQGARDTGQGEPVPYWSFVDAVARGQTASFAGDEAEAVSALDVLLQDAVRQQMVADVPLGAFLSGGIDSSTVVALMQAHSIRPVKTFTIGFNEEGYNEAVHAKAVARHLGTEHTELYVSPQQAMNVIPRLPALYDEPFSDSSQIPTFLVSEMTRQHVTVSLSGDAGDELFGGYGRYFRAVRTWNTLKCFPPPFRSMLASSIRALSVDGWNRLSAPLRPLLPVRMRNIGHKAYKFSDLLGDRDGATLYRHFISHWSDPTAVVVNGREPLTLITQPPLQLDSITEQMMALDTLTYLPDDILCKVDRAAMGVSLETRVPFLDHRVVEFAWRLPLSMKTRNGQGKWILRQVLYNYVPRELIERPKMGFGVPIDTWLRGPLRDWAESLLDESRLRQEGFFNPKPIRQKWAEHLSGKRNWQYHLWDVLMFNQWVDAQKTAAVTVFRAVG